MFEWNIVSPSNMYVRNVIMFLKGLKASSIYFSFLFLQLVGGGEWGVDHGGKLGMW